MCVYQFESKNPNVVLNKNIYRLRKKFVFCLDKKNSLFFHQQSINENFCKLNQCYQCNNVKNDDDNYGKIIMNNSKTSN